MNEFREITAILFLIVIIGISLMLIILNSSGYKNSKSIVIELNDRINNYVNSDNTLNSLSGESQERTQNINKEVNTLIRNISK